MSQFYFAWVNPGQTTFLEAFEREDEIIKTASIEHAEGGFATLTIQVENPEIGLLAPGRKSWAWVSFEDDSIVTPIFFGQLVGIPTDILGKVVTLVFIAKPLDYKEQKQDLAETLKKKKNYDPIFLDPAKRDDPDAILEGYSALYHIDRVTHEITISDVLVGEDGMETFHETDIPGDSVQIRLGQTPLRNITVNATVGWSQAHKGIINGVIDETILTYSGDGFVADWPAPLTELQGGWSVRNSVLKDNWDVEKAIVLSYSNNWTNEAKEHNNGDTLSTSWSISDPVLSGPFLETIITLSNQTGILDPFAVPQLNRPAQTNLTYMRVPLWSISASLNLRYEASRQRSERVKFTLRADLQDILVDDEDISSEIITINGADVGLPVIDVFHWLSVSETFVELGTVIIVEDEIDGTSYQIVTTAGTTGSVEPNFSEILGQTTNDGTAVWTSMGSELFSTDVPDWQDNEVTPLGEVILPSQPIVTHWKILLPDHPPPSVGASVSEGMIIRSTNGSFQLVTQAGVTDTEEPDFSTDRGDVTTSGTAEFTSLGMERVGGHSYQIAISAGTTGDLEPAFNEDVGDTTNDGSVVWASLGKKGAFISKPIGNSGRRSYFTIDRGLESIEYLINMARARLRIRARAVEITFNCRFERALELSCRQNATIIDRRLPGGFARGKIISYSLLYDGESGIIIGQITIGCAIGQGGEAVIVEGEPDYADDDLFEPGIQEYVGKTRLSPEQDVTFVEPIDKKSDAEDDLVFPLEKRDVVVRQGMRGVSVSEQERVIRQAFLSEALVIPPTATTVDEAIAIVKLLEQRNKNGVQAKLSENPRYYELELLPLNGGPFDVQYDVEVDELIVPKMIDLEAPSA